MGRRRAGRRSSRRSARWRAMRTGASCRRLRCAWSFWPASGVGVRRCCSVSSPRWDRSIGWRTTACCTPTHLSSTTDRGRRMAITSAGSMPAVSVIPAITTGARRCCTIAPPWHCVWAGRCSPGRRRSGGGAVHPRALGRAAAADRGGFLHIQPALRRHADLRAAALAKRLLQHALRPERPACGLPGGRRSGCAGGSHALASTPRRTAWAAVVLVLLAVSPWLLRPGRTVGSAGRSPT